MNLVSVRLSAPKRYLHVIFLALAAFAVGGIILQFTRYAPFYSTGLFTVYHKYMTPDFAVQNAPVSEIPVNELGYSAVVLYLISTWRLRELMLSLSYLHKHVPMHPWPIVLFHTEDMDDRAAQTEFLLRLYDYLGGGQDARWFIDRIEFVYVHLELPRGISHNKAVVDPVFIDYWPGYHLMCGFFATQIFDHPRLTNVTYYMRLDTDSYIFAPVCEDPVARFHARNATYGYRSRTTDPDWVTRGMWALADDFAEKNAAVENRLRANGWTWPKERKKGAMDEEDFPTYYNNFEIVKLEAFRRRDLREWLDEVQRNPENIYKYRWGDAPIRYATVNMFFDVATAVQEYCDVDYWHNGVQGDRCSCGGRGG